MDYREYSEQMSGLGDRWKNECTRAWQRYVQFLGEASSKNWNVPDVNSRMGEFARNEGAKFAGRLMQQNLEYYVSVVNLGLDLTHRAFEAALAPTDEKPTQHSETGSHSSSRNSEQTEIRFSSEKGERQSQAFIVANKQSEDVKVDFEISEFVGEDGKTRVRMPVSFEPARFTLKPGQERAVECRLTVTDALPAGQRYQALARVAGFDDMLIRLSIASE